MVWGGNRRRRSKCPQFCHCSGIHPFKDPLRRPFPREREKQTLIAAAVTAPSESSSFKRTGLPGSSCPLFAVMRSREGRRKNADATLHQYRADSFGTPQGAGDGARRPGENGTKQTKPCPKSAACRGMRRGFGPPTMFRQNSRKGASSHPGPRRRPGRHEFFAGPFLEPGRYHRNLLPQWWRFFHHTPLPIPFESLFRPVLYRAALADIDNSLDTVTVIMGFSATNQESWKFLRKRRNL